MMHPVRFKARQKTLDLSKPVLMGVLNVTPDSFSDGGRFLDRDAAVQRGLEMVRQGARIIDVGGESTRPGAKPVSSEQEKKRVLPVIERLAKETDALISVDTCKPDVAAAALNAGADVVNDVTGFTNPKMRAVVGRARAGAVVMHMQGTPRTMQQDPRYGDVVAEVKAFLARQAAKTRAAGALGVMIDPGIGFGKTLEHNLELLMRLDEFADLYDPDGFRYPLCVGVSRKRFIGALTNEPVAENRLEGTLAAVTACVMRGANVLRVHDVGECRKAVEVAVAMKNFVGSGKPLDELRVQGIVVKARTGILPREKKTSQPLIVNVVAFLDLKPAAKSNDVSDTVDYRRIVQTVEKTAASRHWPLLESLAEALAEKVKALGVARVCVQITKPESLKNGLPSVTIER